MLVKLGNYIVDSKNKESIAKVVKEHLNRHMSAEYIDTKSGGFDSDRVDAHELILNTNLYRKFGFSCAYSTVETPYGQYCNNEKSVYKNAKRIYEELNEIEKICRERDAIESCGEPESNLSEISLDFPEDKESNITDAKKEKIAQAKECFGKMELSLDITDEEMFFLYRELFHEYFRTGGFNASAAKYQLIEKGKLAKAREKYKYFETKYAEVAKIEIEKAKKDYYEM